MNSYSVFLVSCWIFWLCLFKQLWALPITSEQHNSKVESDALFVSVVTEIARRPNLKFQLFAKGAQEGGAPDATGGVAVVGDGKFDATTDSGDYKPIKELTINIPKYETNEYGEWIYNPWAVTYGDVFRDTRYYLKERKQHLAIDYNAPKNYNIQESDSKGGVCRGRSTYYQKLEERIQQWGKRIIYKKAFTKDKSFWHTVRRKAYQMGNSEECHTPQMTDWRKYIECALRRNQRMESHLYGYPWHQAIYGD